MGNPVAEPSRTLDSWLGDGNGLDLDAKGRFEPMSEPLAEAANFSRREEPIDLADSKTLSTEEWEEFAGLFAIRPEAIGFGIEIASRLPSTLAESAWGPAPSPLYPVGLSSSGVGEDAPPIDFDSQIRGLAGDEPGGGGSGGSGGGAFVPPAPTPDTGDDVVPQLRVPLVLLVAPDPHAYESPATTGTSSEDAGTGPSTGLIRLSRVGPTDAALPVFFRVSGSATFGAATANDYTLGAATPTSVSGVYTATIPSGQLIHPILVTPIDDSLGEGTEQAEFALVDPPTTSDSYTVDARTNRAVISIADDDPPAGVPVTGPSIVRFGAMDLVAQEAFNSGYVDLVRSANSSAESLDVRLRISGSATYYDDYTLHYESEPETWDVLKAVPGTQDQYTITFAPGATSQRLYLSLKDDDHRVIVLPDGQYDFSAAAEATETVGIEILPNTAYRVEGPASTEIAIYDNDPEGIVKTRKFIGLNVSHDPTMIVEGQPGGMSWWDPIYIAEDINPGQQADFLLLGSATRSVDYRSKVTYPILGNGGALHGQTVIDIETFVDNIPEETESVELVVLPFKREGGIGYTIEVDGTFGIHGHESYRPLLIVDPPSTVPQPTPLTNVRVESVDPSASELGRSTGTFRVSRDADDPQFNQPLVVHYRTASPGSLDGLDENEAPDHDLGLSGTITIPANKRFAVLNLLPTDDGLLEGPEEVELTLIRDPGDLSRYAVAGSSAKIRIEDDDTRATFHNTILAPGEPFTATARTPNGDILLATFTDTETDRTVDDFTATIDWGNGEGTTEATITGGNGVFEIRGEHTFDEPDSREVRILLKVNYYETPGNRSTAVVYERPLSAVVTGVVHTSAIDLTPTELDTEMDCCGCGCGEGEGEGSESGSGSCSGSGSGSQSGSGSGGTSPPPPTSPPGAPNILPDGSWIVARFTSPYADALARYKATVYLGDGRTVVYGEVREGSGEGAESGSQSGSESGSGGAGAGGPFGEGEGEGSGSGSGSESGSSSGSASGSGEYIVVVDPHDYPMAGRYHIRTVLRDFESNLDKGGEIAGTVNSMVTVASEEPEDSILTVTPFEATESSDMTGVSLGTVAVPNGSEPEDYVVQIHLGRDDVTTIETGKLVATETSEEDGLYEIHFASGDDRYPVPGVYGVLVRLSGNSTLQTFGTTAVVRDATVARTGPASAGIELPAGDSFEFGKSTVTIGNYRLASASDADASDTGGTYRAFVTWGDGSSNDAIVHGSGGTFWLEASHAYETPGHYRATAYVTEDGAAGDAWEIASTVRVVEAVEGRKADGSTGGIVYLQPADTFDDVRAWGRWPLTPVEDDVVAGAARVADAKAIDAEPNYSLAAGYYRLDLPGTRLDLPNPGVFQPVTTLVKGSVAAGGTSRMEAGDAPFRRESVEAPQFRLDEPSGEVSLVGFFDPDSDAPNAEGASARYAATIDWGDGGTDSTGTILRVGDHRYQVESDGHTYESAGTFDITVVVEGSERSVDDRDPNASLVFRQTVEVVDDANVAALEAYQRRNERDNVDWLPAGPLSEVSPNTGALRIAHALDFDASPGTAVGWSPHLVYNSDTVDPRPVIEGRVRLGEAAVAQIEAKLTWHFINDWEAHTFGSTITTQTFAVPDAVAGSPHRDVLIAMRPPTPSTTSEVHPWKLEIKLIHPVPQGETVAPPPTVREKSGLAQSVVNNGAFGKGWSLDDDWRIVKYQKLEAVQGAMLVYGTGESRLFLKQENGLGYISPPEDFGHLEESCGEYTYVSKHGETWRFDEEGRLKKVLDRHGQKQLEFVRDGIGRLTAVKTIDGHTTRIEYDVVPVHGSAEPTVAVAFRESGERSVELELVNGNLGKVFDADGGVREFSYSSNGSLPGALITKDTWEGRESGYEYDASYPFVSNIRLGAISDNGTGSTPLTAAARRGFGMGGTAEPITSPRWRLANATIANAGRAFTGVLTHPVDVNLATEFTVDPLGRTGFVVQPLVKASTVDGSGNVTEAETKPFESYRRNAAGQAVAFTDALDRATMWDYDDRGNMVRIDYPDAGFHDYAYTAAFSLLESDGDSYGATTRRAYDTKGELVRVDAPLRAADEEPAVTIYKYFQTTGTFGLLKSTTDARGHETSYSYDAKRRLETTTDAAGGVTHWFYDDAGNVELTVDPRNNSTLTEYDKRNRLVSRIDAIGGEATWTYNAQDQLLTATDERDVTTAMVYSSRGLLESTTEAQGTALARTTGYLYDTAGNAIQVTAPRAYDEFTGPPDPTDPATAITKTDYDSHGRAVRVVAGYGTDKAISTFAGYDKVGNRVFQTETQKYDSPGIRGSTVFDAAIDILHLTTFDARDRATDTSVKSMVFVGPSPPVATNFLAPRGSSRYDREGRIVREIAPDDTTTIHDYDAWGMTTSTTRAAGTAIAQTTTFAYDAVGNATDTIEIGLNRVTRTVYDAVNRPVAVTEALGNPWLQRTTHTKYDAAGNVVAVAEPRFPDSSLAVAGVVTPNWDPVGSDGAAKFVVATRAYDALNRLSSVTVGANLPQSIEWAPDAAGTAPPLLPHLRPVTTYSYDEVGHVVTVTDPLGRQNRSIYDELGRMTEELQGWESGTFESLTGYWRGVRREYDAADNLRAETRRGWSSGGPLDGLVAQTVQDVFGYDVHDRRTFQTLAATADDQGVSGVFSAIAAKTEFVYDAAGNSIRVVDPRSVATRTYFDPLNRPFVVVEAEDKNVARETWFTHDAADRIIRKYEQRFHAGQTVAGDAWLQTKTRYDALGRTTSVTEAYDSTSGLARTTRYDYDAGSRLVGVRAPLGRTTTYGYDLLDRRVLVAEGSGGGPVGLRTSTYGFDVADNMIWEAQARLPGYLPTLLSPAAFATVASHVYDGLDRKVMTTAASNAGVASNWLTPSANQLDAPAPKTRTVYDAAGRVVLEIGPLRTASSGWAASTGYSYDALDQPLTVDEGAYDFGETEFVSFRQDQRGYDGSGNAIFVKSGVQKSIDAGVENARTTETAFDALGRPVLERRSIDATRTFDTTYAYDAAGHLTETLAAGSASTSLAEKRRTRFAYDWLGRKTDVTVAAVQGEVERDFNRLTLGYNGTFADFGFTTSYVYDAIDGVRSVTDPRGVRTDFLYDELGRKTQETAAAATNGVASSVRGGQAAMVSLWFHDAADRVAFAIDPRGAVAKLEYDAVDRTVATTEAYGTALQRTTTVAYDAADHPLLVVAGASPTATLTVGEYTFDYSAPVSTAFEYDPLGRRRAATTLALVAPWTKWTYDGEGNATKIRTNTSTAATNSVSVATATFDWLGRPTLTVDGATEAGDTSQARIVANTYSASDDLVKVVDANDVTTRIAYDRLGRKIATNVGKEDGSRLITTYTLNPFGEAVKVQSPEREGGIIYEYDRLGRLYGVDRIDYSANFYFFKTKFRYDANGNKVQTVDGTLPSWYESPTSSNIIYAAEPRFSNTTTLFDAHNRPIEVTDALNKKTRTQYSAGGDVVQIVDRRGHRRYFDHDLLGRKTAEIWVEPNANLADYGVDVGITANLSFQPSAVFGYAYDAADRETHSFEAANSAAVAAKVVGPDHMHFSADLAAAVPNPGTAERRAYDAAGRLANSTTDFLGWLQYAHDAAGRVVQTLDSRGATVATVYDRAGRAIERIAAADSQAAHWTETYHAAQLNGGRSDLPQTLTYRAGASAATPVAMTRTLSVDWFGREYDRVFDIPEVRTAEVLTTNYGTNGLVSGVWREGTNPTGMADDDSAATYEYTARGQVSKLTTSVGNTSHSVENKYDAAGNAPFTNAGQAAGRLALPIHPFRKVQRRLRRRRQHPHSSMGRTGYRRQSRPPDRTGIRPPQPACESDPQGRPHRVGSTPGHVLRNHLPLRRPRPTHRTRDYLQGGGQSRVRQFPGTRPVADARDRRLLEVRGRRLHQRSLRRLAPARHADGGRREHHRRRALRLRSRPRVRRPRLEFHNRNEQCPPPLRPRAAGRAGRAAQFQQHDVLPHRPTGERPPDRDAEWQHRQEGPLCRHAHPLARRPQLRPVRVRRPAGGLRNGSSAIQRPLAVGVDGPVPHRGRLAGRHRPVSVRRRLRAERAAGPRGRRLLGQRHRSGHCRLDRSARRQRAGRARRNLRHRPRPRALRLVGDDPALRLGRRPVRLLARRVRGGLPIRHVLRLRRPRARRPGGRVREQGRSRARARAVVWGVGVGAAGRAGGRSAQVERGGAERLLRGRRGGLAGVDGVGVRLDRAGGAGRSRGGGVGPRGPGLRVGGHGGERDSGRPRGGGRVSERPDAGERAGPAGLRGGAGERGGVGGEGDGRPRGPGVPGGGAGDGSRGVPRGERAIERGGPRRAEPGQRLGPRCDGEVPEPSRLRGLLRGGDADPHAVGQPADRVDRRRRSRAEPGREQSGRPRGGAAGGGGVRSAGSRLAPARGRAGDPHDGGAPVLPRRRRLGGVPRFADRGPIVDGGRDVGGRGGYAGHGRVGDGVQPASGGVPHVFRGERRDHAR